MDPRSLVRTTSTNKCNTPEVRGWDAESLQTLEYRGTGHVDAHALPGGSWRMIGKVLERSPSTLSGELRCNTESSRSEVYAANARAKAPPQGAPNGEYPKVRAVAS